MKTHKPLKVVRKLELKKQKVIALSEASDAKPPRCTYFRTGCGPVHTC